MTATRIRAFATRAVAVLLLAAGLIAPYAATAPEGVQSRGVPAPETSGRAPIVSGQAEKLKRRGLPNLGRVSETLYRGGQPTDQGYRELRKLGIGVLINLRNEKTRIAAEQTQVESLGMRYVSIPWSGYKDPHNRQVAEFLSTLRGIPGQKVYVHCRRGAERTGVMLAAWRMAVEGWSAEQALAEMDAFKFRGWWFGHLKRYVKNFPEQLQSDLQLRMLEASARGSH